MGIMLLLRMGGGVGDGTGPGIQYAASRAVRPISTPTVGVCRRAAP
ncbi:hypothetical protein [Ornithinimicrobium pratense]|nr:hypothetical protein [Ornithinimicrobium pratense]